MKTGNLSIALVVLALVAGLSLGIAINEVRSDVVTEEVIVNQTVEVEVPVEVEVEKDLSSILNSAVEKYLAEVRDDLDQYEAVTRVDVDDVWSINLDEDYKSVSFSVEYRIIDTLTNARQDFDCNVLVEYDFDEDEIEVTSVC